MVEPEHLDRVSGPRLLYLLAAVVVQRAHLAGGVARDDRVADTQRPAVHEDRGHGPAPHVEAGLDDDARGVGAGVRTEVELRVRHEQDLLEQVGEVRLCFADTSENWVVPPPVLGLQALGGELALTRSALASAMSILLTATTIGTSRPRVRDRLLRLRHDPVVGRHDEHGDVRHLRPPARAWP